MSNTGRVREELHVGRSDPVYMAHAYLTKVPVPAIAPFIESYCPVRGVVADPFAGSGMTGVAAAMLGRAAKLSDISVLGRHIGGNYVNLVDAELLHKHAEQVVRDAEERLGSIYQVVCERCEQEATLVKAVWSIVVKCRDCAKPVNYYRSLDAAGWQKSQMVCGHCRTRISSRSERVGEERVLDSVSCACSPNQFDQPPAAATAVNLAGVDYPRVAITPDREMYKISGLAKSGMTTIASFYSPRNLAALSVLREQIADVETEAIRQKLMFALTACLTRASKRYQWSRQRPLNAANANYYVAAVFYEWNVFDLFRRKVRAAAKSDEYVRSVRRHHVPHTEVDTPDVSYSLASADRIPLPDASVDYVFTDPPFGSNLFYADMALFQEAWLGGFTDASLEAVIDRSATSHRTAERYEALLTNALRECRRVTRPGGRISMVFGNSSGVVWGLVQRSIAAAGLAIDPDALVVLNKGQRSVKGLASGFEDTATLDLIITMTTDPSVEDVGIRPADRDAVSAAVRHLAEREPATPSHLYLELLRTGIRQGWRLDDLHLREVTAALLEDGWDVDPKTGRLAKDGSQFADAATLW